jgi:citrate lyase subunit beta/citryl-CoA lyase
MKLRSMLFVPGDRPDRMEKALASGADALILDLEDSVTAANKGAARQTVAKFLAETRIEVSLWVRINPLDSGMTQDDLAAAHGADGIVLPKAENGADVASLDAMLGGIAARARA